MTKLAAIVCAGAALACTPTALASLSGRPVTLAIGAFSVEFSPRGSMDVGLHPACLVEACPLADVSLGPMAEPVYRTAG